ncbi:MAG: hypothetical protein ACTHMJ_07850 [Thermomicrobiales bacterium]
MKTATTIAQWLVRCCGVVLIALGLLFWTENALSLVPIHMLLGLVLVLSLWTLAGLAARAGVNPGLVALAIVWGLIVPVLGMTQASLLPGSLHWIVRIVHLLVGLAAIWQAENLAERIKGRLSTRQVATAALLVEER